MMIPRLETDMLGQPVHGRSFYECVIGPSSAGDGWSAYCLYKDHIVRRDPWTIYEIDLQTEEVTPYHGQLCDTWFLFAMPDGCIYTFPEDTDDPSGPKGYVARVNPKKKKLEIFGPGSPDSWNYCWCWGPDDFIYIGGWRLHHAMRFDPRTGEFVDYGVQGPECRGGIYHTACDGKFLYTTMGREPFYLLAMSLETREQEILLQLPYPERLVLESRQDGVFARREKQPWATGETEVLGYCSLTNKVLTEISDWPEPEPHKEAPGSIVKPKVLSEREPPMCRADGTATLWYQSQGEDWRSVTFVAGSSPSYLFRLGTFGDGKVVGASEDPYNLFQYDPITGDFTVLGAPYGLHVYAFQGCGGKGYFVGYSGAPVYEWDPGRPWTCLPATPDSAVPDARSPEANPRLVASMENQRRAYDIVLAADGRLYVPCSAYVEALPGGLLGWYDPRTGEAGGTRDGFEEYRGFDAETSDGGRYVVCTTVPWPTPEFSGDAMLVSYDTTEHEVIGRVPILPGSGEQSPLVEWRPGLVVGYIADLDADNFAFYLFDVRQQKVEVGLRQEGNLHGKLLKLPDGMIGFLEGDVAWCLDPDTWRASPFGRLPRPPRDWMVLGQDLYLVLNTHAARVRDIHAGGATSPRM
ncbi:MAG: hypothetical protein HY318_01045 [Armatimonadetes bacterium]|nr:hypothetical protein [Armatimonadota bacterium]